MNSLYNFSIWIIMATIAPGLVTIATIALMIYLIEPETLLAYTWVFGNVSEWIFLSFAVLIMVITQSVGILTEKILIKFNYYKNQKPIEAGIYKTSLFIEKKLETDSTFQRNTAQYLLSNNILGSFIIAIITGIGVYIYQPFSSQLTYSPKRFIVALIIFAVLFIINIIIAKIRYNIYQQSLDYVNKLYDVK